MKAYVELCKPRIAFFSAAAAAAGFLLASPRAGLQLAGVSAGVLLLACGSCALNQYSERDIDARMERTRLRPVPSGRIRPGNALVFSLALMTAGLLVLILAAKGPGAPVAGLLAAAWYNGVYTPLKRRTAFAAVPGALTGALPPAVGWMAAGASLSRPGILFFCALFFIWQVPHYWLLVLRHGREYEKAGLPSLTSRLSNRQLMRIIAVWICATATGGLLTCLYGLVSSPLAGCLIFAGSFLLMYRGVLMARAMHAVSPLLFKSVNLYMLFVVTLVSVDRFDLPSLLK